MHLTQTFNAWGQSRHHSFPMKKIFILIFAGLTCSSCATIFTGSKAKVTVDSNIRQPVSLTVDGYKYNHVQLPHVIKVKKGFSETLVKAETEGYQPTMLMIDKNFNAVAVLNMFGLLGWAIDAATGAMMKPEYKYYEIEFTEKKEE